MGLRASTALLPVLLLAAGCETTVYYAQAVSGHMQIMAAARPVDEILADGATPAALRARLELAEGIRGFASRALKLPDNGSYRRYARLERAYAVWNVVSAGEFSVAATESCFPVAGCVTYRGFFSLDAAQSFAAARRAEGLDVHIAGVAAYSTLGWFDDPLLSTFIDRSDAQLARLIFHELAHQVVYVQDDTTFNESFAVVVEEEGVRRWLAATGREAELADFQAAQARKREFVALIEDARARLAALYAQPIGKDAMRAQKRAEFAALGERYAALKARWGGDARFDRTMRAPNNALLAAIAAYTGRVPEIRCLLEDSGGDFEGFYARVRALAARAPVSPAEFLRCGTPAPPRS